MGLVGSCPSGLQVPLPSHAGCPLWPRRAARGTPGSTHAPGCPALRWLPPFLSRDRASRDAGPPGSWLRGVCSGRLWTLLPPRLPSDFHAFGSGGFKLHLRGLARPHPQLPSRNPWAPEGDGRAGSCVCKGLPGCAEVRQPRRASPRAHLLLSAWASGQWFPARSLGDGLSAGDWFVGWTMAPQLRPLEGSGSAAAHQGPVLGRPLAAGERLAGSMHMGPALGSRIARWRSIELSLILR